MEQYIPKSALVAEIEKIRAKWFGINNDFANGQKGALTDVLSFIDTLEVKDPYEQCIQYDSIEAGIQEHAEIYSFNIESELFNQLTKEQQALWRKEIEQACISGGEVGVELARDTRYKENFEVKEVEETEQIMKECPFRQDICNRYRGTHVKCDGRCSWVVDHLKLKELNAQKGK